MPAPHYYASTSGILVDRFLKYGVYPFAYGAGLALTKKHEHATQYARVISLASAAMITTTFLGLESQAIDSSARNAVSASMGVDPEQLQFTDYKRSSNVIVRKAYDDLMHLQKWRYGTDLFFMLPTIIEMAYGKLKGHIPPTKNVVQEFDHRDPSHYRKQGYSGFMAFLQGHVGWAMSAYAGKAAYWLYETFFVDKTAYYDVVKLRENLEATGKDIAANDLKGIYQRARSDRKLPMVSMTSRKENDALRGLLKRMADEYNKHDGRFGVNEIIYLIGENKINIHAADQKTFSQEAVEQSYREIDKLVKIGLAGIREENRAKYAHSGAPGIASGYDTMHRTFSERFTNGTVNTLQSILGKGSKEAKRPEEYVSERDPTNIIGVSGGMN